MARHISIVDNQSTIQMTVAQDYPSPGGSSIDNINKSQIIDMTILDAYQMVIVTNNHHRPFIYIDYRDVDVPTVVSVATLYAALMSYWLNVPTAGVFATSGTFVNADLVGGVYTGANPYNTTTINVTTLDTTGKTVSPTVTATSTSAFALDFGGAIGAGTYTFLLVAHP